MLFLEHVPLLAEAVYPIWLESYYRSTRERARVTCATAVAERRPRRSPSAHPAQRTPHRPPLSRSRSASGLAPRASRPRPCCSRAPNPAAHFSRLALHGFTRLYILN